MAEAPLKPDRPLASLVFSDTGKVQKSIEDLPRTQKDLEIAVAKKFAGSLAKFQEIDLDVLEPEESQADIRCNGPANSSIGLQVTEVVDPLMIQLQEQRRTYRDHFLANFDDLLSKFSGCHLSITDPGHAPLLPKVSSKDGETAIASLADRLAEVGEAIAELPVGNVCATKAEIAGVQLIISCRRFRMTADSAGYAFEWGGARLFLPEDGRDFVTSSIQKKIAKHYAPTDDLLWLLAYSTDVFRTADDTDIAEANALLSSAPHPFDKAWYFYPYSEHKFGHLILLWDRST